MIYLFSASVIIRLLMWTGCMALSVFFSIIALRLFSKSLASVLKTIYLSGLKYAIVSSSNVFSSLKEFGFFSCKVV